MNPCWVSAPFRGDSSVPSLGASELATHWSIPLMQPLALHVWVPEVPALLSHRHSLTHVRELEPFSVEGGMIQGHGEEPHKE